MGPSQFLPRPLPEPLSDLAGLALDLRWGWDHTSDPLWQAIDPEMWEASPNPWLILRSASQGRLEELAGDQRFRAELAEQVEARRTSLAQPTWFSRAAAPGALPGAAFFSMEFGLTDALPIYSGGLGILAGDALKAAGDLGVPLAGVGLLYQQGSFRQSLDADGNQLESYAANDPGTLPMLPLRDGSGEWLRISVELPGRNLVLRAWQVQVGRTRLYLLDSNDPQNSPGDRRITGELYGRDIENRLHQEIALGIGGWRLLKELEIDCAVCHLNEAHAAFAVLERAREHVTATGASFGASLLCTRAGNLLTTHTTAASDFDCFPSELISQHFRGYAAQLGLPLPDLLALGRSGPEDRREQFNMTYLALHGCGRVNAASRLHGDISRRLCEPLFPRWPVQEIPIGTVTNGVHVPSWESAAASDLWTVACGTDRWNGTGDTLEHDLLQLSDEALWASRSLSRRALVDSLCRRLERQAAARVKNSREPGQDSFRLDAETLTIGLAYRFTRYKRPNLLLRDPERLTRLLSQRDRPVQLIVAGKAHPLDIEGKQLIREWAMYVRSAGPSARLVFIEDYDLALSLELTRGVDLWLSTPRHLCDASGTGGMKVLVNGGLNLSELDGWWAEAYTPEVGWALGGCQSSVGGDHDEAEAEQLFDLLEKEVVPAFYDRAESGIPAGWVARMRQSMARLTPIYSAHRMIREYTERHYLPCASTYRERCSEDGKLGVSLHRWQQTLADHWPGVRFGKLEVQTSSPGHIFGAEVFLGGLPPDMIRIELYADAAGNLPAVKLEMSRGGRLDGDIRGYLYTAVAPADRPAGNYTPRVLPSHPELSIPLEEAHALWQR